MKASVSSVVPSTTVGLTEGERLRQELLRIEDTDELSPVFEGGPGPEDEEPTRLSGGEEGETEVELTGREVAFNAPDEEPMSGPINPHEDNDLLREENLEEVEKGENQ